jgi:hypothetical protein
MKSICKREKNQGAVREKSGIVAGKDKPGFI